MPTTARIKSNPVHAKLDWQLRLNEKVLLMALRNWFASTTKQIQLDLRTKFQKDITSDLTSWETISEEGKVMVRPATLDIVDSGGKAADKVLRAKVPFDKLNPEAVKAADKICAEMVREVTGETKKALRSYISAGIREGKSMDRIARELRPLVSLTKHQTDSVVNYRNLLREKSPRLPEKSVNKKVERYAAKTQRRRVQTIARTEAARAQNTGYALSMGDMGVEQLEFSVASGCCKLCESMNERKYPPEKAGAVIPVHPNCRCCMLPVVDDVPTCRGEKGEVAKKACIRPSNLHDEQVKDLLNRLERVKDPAEGRKVRRALRRLGHKGGLRAEPTVPTAPRVKPTRLKPSKLPHAVTVDEEYWHVTTQAAAKNIKKEGFKIIEAEVGGKIYGNGIYLGSYEDKKALQFYQSFIRASKRKVMKVPVRVNGLLEVMVKPAQEFGKTCAQAARHAGLNKQYQQAKSRILAKNREINRRLQKQPLMSRRLEQEWLRQQGLLEYPEGAALQEVLTKRGYNGVKIIAKGRFTTEVGGSQVVVYDTKILNAGMKGLKRKPPVAVAEPAARPKMLSHKLNEPNWKQQAKWEASLSKEELKAVKAWGRGMDEFWELKYGLVGKKPPLEADIIRELSSEARKKLVATFKGVVDKSPLYKGEVWRAMGLSSKKTLNKKFVRNRTVTFNHTQSSSRVKRVTSDFMDWADMEGEVPVLLKVQTKTGTYIGKHSYQKQEEVLLHHGTKYKVKSVKVAQDPEFFFGNKYHEVALVEL